MTSKNKSQHFLKNPGLIDTIIKRAKIRPTDTVLEIGAGTGNITTKLLKTARKVVAFENDRKLARELKTKLSFEERNKLELIEEDVLQHDLPQFDISISNIPFHISLPVVLKLVSCDFRSVFLLVQKEFALRLTARAGSPDYSRLSVMCQLLANVEHIMKVSRNSFTPPPSVDTCFVRIEPKIPRPQINCNELNSLLQICFGRKNKTLSANLKTARIEEIIKRTEEYKEMESSDVVDAILEEAGLQDARPSKMEVEDFLQLLLSFKRAGIHFC